MVERHQRRALPSEHHIGMAEAIHDGHAQEFCEPWPIPNCRVKRFFRPMPDGLAMKPDKIRARDAEIALELADRLAEGVGHRIFKLGQRSVSAICGFFNRSSSFAFKAGG